MAADKPLNVRCAEALGWTTRTCRMGCKCTQWVPPGGTGPAIVPPYGEDSTAGWACTGPLVERFKLLMDSNHGELGVWDDINGWIVNVPEGTPRVTAYAEWVARCGAEAIKREVERG